MDGEPEAYKDDTLRSISISPRERLERIETMLVKIDEKMDLRFDSVEKRIGAVEATQAGQASTAEFVSKATALAEEASTRAAGLARTETERATALAVDAAGKATLLADGQKDFQTAVTTDLGSFKTRLDTFDRKVAWFAGVGATLIVVSGGIGYLVK